MIGRLCQPKSNLERLAKSFYKDKYDYFVLKKLLIEYYSIRTDQEQHKYYIKLQVLMKKVTM
jgi:hypothetical protein